MISKLLKTMIRRMGREISVFTPSGSGKCRLIHTIGYVQPTMVLDVGANAGQFGFLLRELGYTGKILSFEPLSEAHLRLSNNVRRDPNWLVAPRMALGNADGVTEIHVSRCSIASSVLPILAKGIQVDAGCAYVSTERVPLRRLDSVAPRYFSANERLFCKIDVQGYEHEVIAGARNILPQVVCLNLEVSFVPLYEGALLFDEMRRRIEELGFYMWSLDPMFGDTNGQLIQADAIFIRQCTPDAKLGARRIQHGP